ncbi:MAG: 50S ribosome-binding GTPase, partial [Boseongicola sp.]|nr:50S ribosome-binding GTPase [Boseongicola sp.]
TVALVGYTNAGKTSLHAALCGDADPGEPRMFATLDPKVRRAELPGGQLALLIDTVGFINRLPPRLVAAFRATLEEVESADAIVHVADVSSPHLSEKVETVVATLEDLGLGDKPSVLALNKADRLLPGEGPPVPGGLLVSARTGVGLDLLREAIGRAAAADWQKFVVQIPYRNGALLERIRSGGRIARLHYSGDRVLVQGSGPPALLSLLRQYATKESLGV